MNGFDRLEAAIEDLRAKIRDLQIEGYRQLALLNRISDRELIVDTFGNNSDARAAQLRAKIQSISSEFRRIERDFRREYEGEDDGPRALL